MHLRCVLLTFLVALRSFGAVAAEAAPAPHGVPPAVTAAVQALDKAARPLEVRRARCGAFYALLPNGAELIIQEKHTAPVVAVQAFVRTGAIHEGESLGAGLSHFCEHLMFKGTRKRPTGTLDREIRALGGDLNAYTTRDMTVCHVTCQAHGFAQAFDAIADMVMNSTFPPKEVLKEHSVVVKEIEMYQDDPENLLWRTLARLRFRVHPYHLDTLGYSDRFQRVTRQEVWAYYKRRYAPQLTAFVVVGDVSAAKALPLMARTVAAWPRTSACTPALPEEPRQVAPREATVAHPLCQMPKMMIAFPSVSRRHPDRPALDVLATILGEGRSSRLYREIVDTRQLATDIGASTDEYAGYELSFVVWATLEKGKATQARQATLDLLAAATRRAPEPGELARARRKILAQHVFGKMTVDQIADDLGTNWLFTGDLDYGLHYLESIRRVTAPDVLRVATRYLVPHRRSVALLLPETKAKPGPTERAADATQDARVLQARLAALKAQPDVAAASVLHGARAAGAATFEVAFKSGLRLVAREDRSLPAVHVAFACLGGQRWEPAKLEGAANLMARMLDRGTATRTKGQIAAQVEDLGAALATASGHDSFGLSLRCLKEDLPALFELAADCLLHPAWPQDELDRLRREVRAEIAEQDESLFGQNFKLLRPVLYPGHPYGRERLGSVGSIAKITTGDLRKLHAAWLRPHRLAVAFVGDCSAERAVALAREHLRLGSASRLVPPKSLIAPIQGNKPVEKTVKDVKGVTLTLAFRGPRHDHPDREALDLLDALLGGTAGRLGIAMREKQGLAYDVGCTHGPRAGGGAFIFYVQTDPPKLQTCLDAIWREIRKVRQQPLTAKELQDTKTLLAGYEAIGLQSHRRLAARLAAAQILGRGAQRVFARRDRLLRVTAQQLQQAARTYFTPDAWARAIVKPAP